MGGASIPWSRSERRCSESVAASDADADAGGSEDVLASPAAVELSAGVAAASDGLLTLHVGNQDMWVRSVGKRQGQRMSIYSWEQAHSFQNDDKSPDGALDSASALLPIPTRNLLRVAGRAACVRRTSLSLC